MQYFGVERPDPGLFDLLLGICFFAPVSTRFVWSMLRKKTSTVTRSKEP
jgi:hypothetical protein